MTEDDALEMLQTVVQRHGKDTEAVHVEADDILCQFVEELGYVALADAWRAVPKWYA